jgi:hypothetical protein
MISLFVFLIVCAGGLSFLAGMQIAGAQAAGVYWRRRALRAVRSLRWPVEGLR